MNIKIQKAHEDAIIPKYQTKGAAGFDFHAIEDFTLLEGQTSLIKTGLVFEVPEGYELQIRSRSGLALKHGVFVLNGPGTIDSDYRGEVGIILTNAGKNFTIKKGDRIAQGVINAIIQAEFEEALEVSETGRGKGGFGSTKLK